MATVEVDREAVLAAFSSVEALNREAEVSNAALQAILEKSATDSGEAAFEQFCLQLLSSIKTYFGHFRIQDSKASAGKNEGTPGLS